LTALFHCNIVFLCNFDLSAQSGLLLLLSFHGEEAKASTRVLRNHENSQKVRPHFEHLRHQHQLQNRHNNHPTNPTSRRSLRHRCRPKTPNNKTTKPRVLHNLQGRVTSKISRHRLRRTTRKRNTIKSGDKICRSHRSHGPLQPSPTQTMPLISPPLKRLDSKKQQKCSEY